MPVFVDANCFKGRIDAFLLGSDNKCSLAFEHILANDVVALDDEKIFEQEWKECSGGADNIFVSDYVADLMEKGKIAVLSFVRNAHLRKKYRQLGVPSSDIRIIEFSAGANISVINSNDIDFYDPKSKGCNRKRHNNLVHDRRGSVCREIEKSLGISVCCCCRIEEFI